MSMDASETAQSGRQGRIVRFGLMALPVGTVLLGIASFGIWWMKKEHVENRAYAYASALRREMTREGVERFALVAKEVLAMPATEAIPSMAAFLTSSMGAENMGYDVRRNDFCREPVEASVVDVELTGKLRPREVAMAVVFYGGGLEKAEAESRALATLMAMAHSVTGENRMRTVRFAAVPLVGRSPRGNDAMEVLAGDCRGRDERLTHVWVLGEGDLAQVREAVRAEQGGVVVTRLAEPKDSETAVRMGEVLVSEMLEIAEAP